jgi:predicted nucleic acid-binding protein
MSILFLDSSAVTKRYVKETGTAWLIELFRPKSFNRVYVAEIALVEVVSALTRRHRGGSLSSSAFQKVQNRFRRNFEDKFFKIETSLSIIKQAADLAEKHALRGYDAVQLASAVYLHNRRQQAGLSPVTFISADNALNNAANIEGLIVDNPNNHP